MTKPRVLHVCAIGGTATKLLLPQAYAAREAGFDVGFAYSPDLEATTALRSSGFEIIELTIPRNISPLDDIKAIRSLKRELDRWQPDIVHTHTSKGGAIGRFATVGNGKAKTVHTVHGFPFISGQPLLRYWSLLVLEWFMARSFTDILLSQSADDVTLADRYGIRTSAGYPYWIGNGIDIDRFNPIPKQTYRFLRSFGNLRNDNICVLTIARIKQEKGLADMVEALAKLKELPWRWFVVGDVEEDTFYEYLQQRVRELGLQNRIYFLGARENIREILADADWFVLPSYREGIPRSLIEAHAMGVPSIATDIRGCHEVCEHGVTGFVVPARHINALAKTLRKAFLLSPEKYKTMQSNSRRRAIAHFDERDVFPRILNCYKHLLGMTGVDKMKATRR